MHLLVTSKRTSQSCCLQPSHHLTSVDGAQSMRALRPKDQIRTACSVQEKQGEHSPLKKWACCKKPLQAAILAKGGVTNTDHARRPNAPGSFPSLLFWNTASSLTLCRLEIGHILFFLTTTWGEQSPCWRAELAQGRMQVFRYQQVVSHCSWPAHQSPLTGDVILRTHPIIPPQSLSTLQPESVGLSSQLWAKWPRRTYPYPLLHHQYLWLVCLVDHVPQLSCRNHAAFFEDVKCWMRGKLFF